METRGITRFCEIVDAIITRLQPDVPNVVEANRVSPHKIVVQWLQRRCLSNPAMMPEVRLGVLGSWLQASVLCVRMEQWNDLVFLLSKSRYK